MELYDVHFLYLYFSVYRNLVEMYLLGFYMDYQGGNMQKKEKGRKSPPSGWHW